MKLLIIFLLQSLLVSFSQRTSRIRALEWIEVVAQSEFNYVEKASLFERSEIISLHEESLLSFHSQQGYHLQLDLPCFRDLKDVSRMKMKNEFIFDFFLRASRIFYSSPSEDLHLWRHGNVSGVLPEYQILSIPNEILSVKLAMERIEDLHNLDTSSDGESGAIVNDIVPSKDEANLCLGIYTEVFVSILDSLETLAKLSPAHCALSNLDLDSAANTAQHGQTTTSVSIDGTSKLSDQSSPVNAAKQANNNKNNKQPSSSSSSKKSLPLDYSAIQKAALQRAKEYGKHPVYHLLLDNYWAKNLVPFLTSSAYCASYHSLVSYDTAMIIDTTPAACHGNSQDEMIVIVDRYKQAHSNITACLTFATATYYPSLLSLADKIHYCESFYREMYSINLSQLQQLQADQQESDKQLALQAEIDRLNGGGSYSMMEMTSILVKQGEGQQEEGQEEEYARYFFLGGDSMANYISLIATAGLAISPAPLLSHQPDQQSAAQPAQPRMLSLGLGGGTLHAFLRIHFPQLQIESVEMDQTVVEKNLAYFFGQHFICQVNQYMGAAKEGEEEEEKVVVWDEMQKKLEAGLVAVDDDNCKSKLMVADAWKYVHYLHSQLAAQQQQLYYDYIVVDIFDAAAAHWSAALYDGISNSQVSQAIASLTMLRELLVAGSGVALIHLHKDGQFKEYVQQIVTVFGEGQIVFLDHGSNAIIAATRDKYQDADDSSSSSSSSNSSSCVNCKQEIHPCQGLLVDFANSVSEFVRKAGYTSERFQYQFKYALNCGWQEKILS